MQRQPLAASQRDRIAAGLPFVESLARRVASSMPHSIELSDLVQDGMIGLDRRRQAVRRLAGHQVRDIRGTSRPRRDDRRAAPGRLAKGVRRQRRELEAAREQLRRELGAEVARGPCGEAGVGRDPDGKDHRQINTIEVRHRSPPEEQCRRRSSAGWRSFPRNRLPPTAPMNRREIRDRIRGAIALLPPRERKVIGLYYYGEATMKEIGAAIGVNESRVSQLQDRRDPPVEVALGAECGQSPVIDFQSTMRKIRMAQGRRRGSLVVAFWITGRRPTERRQPRKVSEGSAAKAP